MASVICVAVAMGLRSPVVADEEPAPKTTAQLRTWTDTTGTFQIEAYYGSYEKGDVAPLIIKMDRDQVIFATNLYLNPAAFRHGLHGID